MEGSDQAPSSQGEWVSFNVVAAFGGLRFLPWWWGTASNNANPKLEIGPGAIRYRVISRQERGFAEIEQVDVRTAWRTANLCFRFRGRLQTFSANLGNVDEVRRALSLLGGHVPFSEKARHLVEANEG